MRTRIESILTAELPALLFFALALFSGATVFRYLAAPAVEELFYTGKERTFYRELLEENNDAEIRAAIAARLDSLESRATRSSEAFDRIADLPLLLQYLFNLAWQWDISLEKTQPQEEEREGNLVVQEIALTTVGGYGRTISFLEELERSHGSISVEKLHCRGRENGEVESTLLLRCVYPGRISGGSRDTP